MNSVSELQIPFDRIAKCMLLAMVAVGALAIRSINLGASELTKDETFTWRVLSYDLWEMIVRVGRDGHAPLHFVVLWFWTALFGDSVIAMRSLSALAGAATVFVVFATLHEALRYADVGERRWRHVCALLAATLVAIHPLQVTGARTTRMYSIGALGIALATWFLLRALREPTSTRRWIAYGLAAAACCYTHHFAFFTLLAQAIFLGGLTLRDWCVNREQGSTFTTDAAHRSAGFLLGSTFALTLYSPWLPVFYHQTNEVWRDFWIAPLSAGDYARAVLAWSAGLESHSTLVLCMFLPAVLAGSAWAVWRGRAIGWFFLLQAAVPWICCVIISEWGSRPLLQVRYLTFAQFGLVGMLGVALATFPDRLISTLWGSVAILVVSIGLGTTQMPAQNDSGAWRVAVRHICERYHPGDWVIVARAEQVNQVRFYAHQLGRSHIDVRCNHAGFSGPGHACFIASLRSSEVECPRGGQTPDGRRIWRVSCPREGTGALPSGVSPVASWEWETDGYGKVAVDVCGNFLWRWG